MEEGIYTVWLQDHGRKNYGERERRTRERERDWDWGKWKLEEKKTEDLTFKTSSLQIVCLGIEIYYLPKDISAQIHQIIPPKKTLMKNEKLDENESNIVYIYININQKELRSNIGESNSQVVFLA